MGGVLRIGTSGWVYKHWRGQFYPQDLPAKLWFAHYAAQFASTEINGSFYRLPSEQTVAAWASSAPEGFVFAWKASRFITQAKKLKDVGESVQLVYARMAGLGDRLGPALFQLPPQLRLNLDRLQSFLQTLPPGSRNTVEFRHSSWFVDEVFEALRRHNVALCLSDHHDAPAPWIATASWVYVRGHGPGGTYQGRYSRAELLRWSGLLQTWTDAGLDAYAYFDNDIGGGAPLDAAALVVLAR